MQHVDYGAWANFALQILTDNGLSSSGDESATSLLECACGTGTLGTILALCGYRVIGFDRSREMVKIAQNKSTSLDNSPRYFVADFVSFEVQDKFDGVLCLYDSVNYLMNINDVMTYFKRVFDSLKEGGLFLFDICTEENSKRYFADRSETGNGSGYSFHRQMAYDRRAKIQRNSFEIKFSDQPGVTISEKHQQRIYSEHIVRKVVAQTGFQVVEVVDGYTRNPPNRESLRIHFLVRKPA